MRLHLGIAVMALLSACGAPQTTSIGASQPSDVTQSTLAFADVGRACDGVGDRWNPAEYFGDISRLDRVSTDTLMAQISSGEFVDEDLAMPFITTWPDIDEIHDDGRTAGADELFVATDILTDATRLPAGLESLVATTYSDRLGDGWIEFIVLVDSNAEVAFAGECADGFFAETLRDYHEEVRPEATLEALFIEIVTNDATWRDFNDWDTQQGAYAPPTFAELDPRDRQLDIEFTPPEVLDRLSPFTMDVEVPEEWLDIPYLSLCTFVAEGWNTCFALEALDKSTVAQLEGYGTVGEPIEVWVLEYAERGTDDPLGLAGSIVFPPGRTARAEITGSTATSIDAVIEDFDDGALTFTVLNE